MTIDRSEFLDAIAALKADFHREVDTFAETVNQRFEASAEAVITALAEVKIATGKAEQAMNRRLEGMNEFREQLKDQASTFMPRPEAVAAIQAVAAAGQAHHKLVDGRVDALEKVVDQTRGKSEGLTLGWKILIGALGLMVTISTIIVFFIEFTGHAAGG